MALSGTPRQGLETGLGPGKRAFGVIPKPFRMESRFEWRVITKGNHPEMKAAAKDHPKGNDSKCYQNFFGTSGRPK